MSREVHPTFEGAGSNVARDTRVFGWKPID
jgi:hypothetical protein